MQAPGFADDRSSSFPSKRILLLDAHSAFRQALAIMIAQEGIAADVRQAGTVEEGYQALADVDLVVVNLTSAAEQGRAFLDEVAIQDRRASILGLDSTTDQWITAAAEGGGIEIVPTLASAEQVLQTIRRLSDARDAWDPAVPAPITPPAAPAAR